MAGNYIGTLVYRITGETSGVDKSLSETKSKTESFGSHIGGWATKVAGLFAAAFTIGKIVEFDKKLLEVASHSNEVSSRFANTFPGAIAKANGAISELTDSYGYSSTAAKESMSATGGLLATLGMSEDQSLACSEQVAKLGADLASYTDFAGGAKGAADALTKAMLGETESSKSLSLSIGDDALSNYAASLGKSTASMSTAEKAQLRLNLALEQAGAMGAVGDMIKTASGYANTLRAVESKMENAEAAAGQRLIPAVTSLATEFGKACEPGGVFAGALDTIAEAGSGAASVLAGMLSVLNKVAGTQGKDRVIFNEQNISSYNTQMSGILASYKNQESELNKLAAAGNRGAIADKARYTSLKDKIKEATAENIQLNKTMASDTKLEAQKKYNELIEEDSRLRASATSTMVAYDKTLKGMSLEEGAAQTKDIGARNHIAQALANHIERQKEINALEEKHQLTVKDVNTELNSPRKIKTNPNTGGKGNDVQKSAEEARAAIQSLDYTFLGLGVDISDLTDNDLKSVTESLKQASPVVQSFVTAFGGLSNVRAFLSDINNKSITTADLSAKWGDDLSKVGKAAATIKVDSSAEEQLRNALDATNGFGAAMLENRDIVAGFANEALGAFGNVASAISNMYAARTAGLDSAMERELEAAGLSEETELTKANKSLALAQKSGNSALIAEKKKAVEKAAIEDKFAKRKSELEFKGAMVAWEYQTMQGAAQIPLAISSALASAATWKLGPVGAAAFAAMAGASATAAELAVIASKPKRSSYELGGIIPGSSYRGDNIQANVNAGEMILNEKQQKELWKVASGSAGVGQMQVNVYLPSNELWFSGLYDATANGVASVHPNGIATR